MFLREVRRRNKNGTQVSYLQLVHNQWDAAAQASRTKILYSFGRTDQVDPAAIERLIASLSRLLDPAAALRVTASSELTLLASRPLGGTHVLDGMWQRLGIDKVISGLLKGRRRDPRVERVLFALVANRALAASSKLAAAGWVSDDVHIDGLPQTSDDACYRAMDWLLEIKDALEQEIFWQVATLLDLEFDLLFFDTTSTYFELDEADAPWRGTSAAPRWLTPPMATARPRRGFAPTASPRTTAMTCRRSSSGWRSPARGSRSGCGAGRATPPTPR
jgi:hypothetical protein